MTMLKPTPQYVCNTKISIHHWQLLDLVHYDYNSDKLFYTYGDEIRKLSLGPHEASLEKHFDLKYMPKCSDVTTNGVTVTGGLLQLNLGVCNMFENSPAAKMYHYSRWLTMPTHHPGMGLLSVYNPEIGTDHTIRVGDLINNDVKIYDDGNNQFTAYSCNNDWYLYCMDVNNRLIEVTSKINCEGKTALNHVVRNPQCPRLLTVLGDLGLICMVDPSSHDPVLKKITTSHDMGFSIAYHDLGYMFALTFQDGLCLVFDIRNMDRHFAEIRSTRPGAPPGSFRLCKFSPGHTQDDLLVISEHAGRVHVLDARKLGLELPQDHQVVVLPFAIEQYAEFMVLNKRRLQKLRGDHMPENSNHEILNLYDDQTRNYPQFSAPLVYSYDYLSHENPSLFKGFTYTPPPPPPQPDEELPQFKCPKWSEGGSTREDPAVAPKDRSAWIELVLSDVFDDNDSDDTNEFANYVFHDRSPLTLMVVDQSEGEFYISGLEYYSPRQGGSKLVLGSKLFGLVTWDVNAVARRGVLDAPLI